MGFNLLNLKQNKFRISREYSESHRMIDESSFIIRFGKVRIVQLRLERSVF